MDNHFKQIRLKMRMSREDFAAALGLTYAAISHYENGLRKPRLDVCRRILDLAKARRIKVKFEDIYPRKTDLREIQE